VSWLSETMDALLGREPPPAPSTFDWARYWCPREGVIDLSDEGFLFEPGTSLFQSPQDTVAFSEIGDKSCLVLLGEPGIGKSTASFREYETATSHIPPKNKQYIDLRSYSDNQLKDKLFQAPFFLEWLNSDGVFHLYLDSLDECLDRVEHVAHLLRDEISGLPHERLVLRIACRTADWPADLEASLESWYGKANLGVYELAPLTRRNVTDAARASHVDDLAFLAQVSSMELGPLASKPLTLNMLLNLFRNEGKLPDSQHELYERGCLLLCQEPDQQRRRRSSRRKASVDRLATARRIAATTILANKRAVWTGLDDGSVPAEDVFPSEISGGTESLRGRIIDVDEPAISNALSSGLFTSRGPNELGWAHLSYGEFLAAHRLSDQSISLHTITTLLSHPLDPRAVIPQLREVSGWLAGMRDDVRAWVLGVEPRVLLRSDAASIGMHDREALLEALLKEVAREPASVLGFGTRPLLRKLAHPGLAEQLRLVLDDQSRSLDERMLASDVAEVCVVTDLHDTLIRIALDDSEPNELRVDATRTIATTAAIEARLNLKPLVAGGITDPTDDLTGWALRGLWPQGLDATDVFSMLVPYGEQTRFGAYWYFLTEHLVTALPEEDLDIALKWAGSEALNAPTIDSLQQTISQIFSRAWNYVASVEPIADAFAHAALKRIERHYELCEDRRGSDLEQLVGDNPDRRRALAVHIIKLLADGGGDIATAASRVAHASPRLIRPEDLPWLEKQLSDAPAKEQDVILELIYRAFDPGVEGCLGVAVRCSQNHLRAEKLFHSWLGPIELGSKEAQELKESFEQREKWRRERESPKQERPVQEIADILLRRFDDGDWNAWWILIRALKAQTSNEPAGRIAETELATTPGWKAIDESTQARVIESARRYLENGDCRRDEWFGQGVFHWPAEAGYLALRLLLDFDPASIEALSEKTWQAWAPIIVASHSENSTEGQQKQQVLIQGAYRFANAEVITTLIDLIQLEDKEHGSVFVLVRMPQLRGKELEDRLIDLVAEMKIGPAGISSVLSFLAASDSQRVLAIGRGLIDKRAESRDAAVAAAQALFTKQPAQTFDWLMDIFEANPEFAKPVMNGVASVIHWDREQTTQALREEQLGRLFRWLEKNVPPPPKRSGVQARGTADWLTDLSSGVLGDLRARGTSEAVGVLQSLCDDYSQHEGLPWILQEAREVMRRSTWVPASPGEITLILTDSRLRLVQSDVHLVTVLLESLEKLQQSLQGETPQAQFLWNVIGKMRRPKTENDVSDYIKAHLERDLVERGVITGREVEIRRPQGDAPGERTDIHVSAVRPPDRSRPVADTALTIIEVKGSWHGELMTAMRTQLVDRYLKDNSCQTGVYLVAWFNSTQWDENDRRKSAAMRHEFAELKHELDKQATAVSVPPLLIRALVLDAHLR
jgi:hypothetical protein